MTILETAPRTVSVTAIEDTQAFFINSNAFRNIIGESIPKGMVNVLTERIKRDDQRTMDAFKKREKELTDLVEKRTLELQHKNEELLKTQKYKERFLANMSHEIRTPMNAVVGITYLLLNTDVDDRQSKYLETIKQASDNLLVVINDILDFSKIEAGKLEIEKTDFHLRKVIEALLNTVRLKAQEKGLELKAHVEPEITDHLVGDPVRLNQILLNLVGNALKFTSKGKVSVGCRLLDRDETSVHIEFSVTDTGIGISQDKLDHIFESFNQADSDTTRKYGGTGLGLSISRQLVQLQGGNISLNSKPGQGTTFYFDLCYPVGKENNRSSKPGTHNPDLQDQRILIAEDDDYNQMVAKDTLESLIKGVYIDIVENGRQAVEKTRQNHYDLILMDVDMPLMDGYEATRQIRRLPSPARDIRIMAMTASATKTGLQKCIEAGMDDYISKPFKPEDLINKISNLLTKKAGSN